MQAIYKFLTLAILTLGFVGATALSSVAQEFRVTDVVLKADDARLSGTCPLRVVFNGYITTNGPTVVRYAFTRSDGATGPTSTLDFRSAGTQRVTTDWTLGDARALPRFEGWQAIRIMSPNEIESSHATGAFSITCTEAIPARSPSPEILVYSARSRPIGVRSRQFRIGETVILKVDNNSPNPIYYLVPAPLGSEIIRGESLIVERLDGRNWVSAVTRAFIDEPAYRFIELGSRMNLTRQWTNRFAAPGTYRIVFTYYDTGDSTVYESPPVRGGGITLYSETFEVIR